MTIWKPSLEGRSGPRYLAIADAIADAVGGGHLRSGDRLPPHRTLAYDLGITVGTVTRAYAEAERRGLVAGEVGRGTYVQSIQTRQGQAEFSILHDEAGSNVVDLSLNYHPVEPARGRHYAETAARIARDPNVESLLTYQPATGHPRHQAAAAELAYRTGLGRAPERTVVCAGAQHGMTVTLAALCRPGDVVLAEELTYPGIAAVARLLHLRLRGVAIDDEGLLPDALDAACRKGDVKALYCVPTYHNPTSAVMGEERRAEIAAVARRHGVFVVEDDVYGSLREDRPAPISRHLPELAFFISSASKSMMAALRIGFVVAPEPMVGAVADAVRTTTWMASPINAEVMTRWIEDGTLDELTRWHDAESEARLALAARILDGHPFRSSPGGYHIWMPLPVPWTAGDVVARAGTRGVRLLPATPFTVGGTAPEALRLCLGSPRTRPDLERGLGVIAELLRGAPAPPLAVI